MMQIFKFGPELWTRAMVRFRHRPAGLYIGYEGRGNIGDDAVFLAIKKIGDKIAWLPVLEGRRESLSNRLGLNEHDLAGFAVLGGGTTISMERYRSKASELLASGVPMWCCGAGVGSSGWEQEPEPNLSLWSGVLERFNGIGVRGPLSHRKLLQIGLKDVDIVGDLALSLVTVQPRAIGDSTKTIAMNVSLPSASYDLPDARILDALVRVAERFRQQGGQVLPLAMDVKDMAPLHEFCRRIGLDSRRILYAAPRTVVRSLRTCCAVVGVRLHSAVLAACAGVPPVLLGYRDKCIDFMLSMDAEAFHIPLDARTAQTLDGHIDEKLTAAIEQAELGRKIHDKARHWAMVQRRFVQRMIQLSPEI